MNLTRLTCLSLRWGLKPPNNVHPPVCRLMHLTLNQNKQQRLISSVETVTYQKDENFLKRMLKKVSFFDMNKSRMLATGYLLYEHIVDKINYGEFFDEFDLPDTFYSWFVVTELHIWMLSCRAMAEGDTGRHLRNYIVEALWNDVNQRIKRLGDNSNPAAARQQITELSEQLQAALIGYDEGIFSDDTVLAGALWRRIFQQRDVDPLYLDTLVKYVRKQMRLLDHLSRENFFERKNLEWISLN